VGSKWIPIDAMVLNITAQTPKDIEQFEPKGKFAEDKKLVMGYVVAYDSGIPLDFANHRTLRQRCHSTICEELSRQSQKMAYPRIQYPRCRWPDGYV
jgi:hypothetical protein